MPPLVSLFPAMMFSAISAAGFYHSNSRYRRMGSPRSLGIPFVRPHHEVQFNVWTRKYLGDPKLVAELLAVLATSLPEALPVKWGDIEPYRIRVTPNNYQQAIDFWVESSRGYHTIQGRTDTRKGCKSCVMVSFACGPRSGQTHGIGIFLQKVACWQCGRHGTVAGTNCATMARRA